MSSAHVRVVLVVSPRMAKDQDAAVFLVALVAFASVLVRCEASQCDVNLVHQWQTTPPSVGFYTSAVASSYDSVIQELMKKYALPAASVAVVNQGRLVFAKGYGFANNATPDIAHPDSRFRVASLSKWLTAAGPYASR